MSRSADKLTDGSQFFRLKNLCLQALQIVEGFARVVEQAYQFAVQNVAGARMTMTPMKNAATKVRARREYPDSRRNTLLSEIAHSGEKGKEKTAIMLQRATQTP